MWLSKLPLRRSLGKLAASARLSEPQGREESEVHPGLGPIGSTVTRHHENPTQEKAPGKNSETAIARPTRNRGATTMNIQFGTGVLFGVPNAGNLAANPTPYKFGVLQEAQVTFKGDLKKLYGQKQFAVAKARGKVDVSCKAKLAVVDPGMLNQLYFGQNATPGSTIMADDEAGAIPGSSPYTVAVTNHSTFVSDFGVRDAVSGTQFIKVASAPVAGQYSCDTAGNYTFASADAGKAVLISYTYTANSRGQTIILNNQLTGYAPEFRAFLYNSFRGKFLGIELFNCTMGQISIPTKQEDFWIVDIDFEAATDASDTLGKLYADQ
jgi:hypothetical protein